MASNAPVKPDPKQVKHAEALWAQFTEISKWAIIAVCVVMVGLALAFVPFS